MGPDRTGADPVLLRMRTGRLLRKPVWLTTDMYDERHSTKATAAQFCRATSPPKRDGTRELAERRAIPCTHVSGRGSRRPSAVHRGCGALLAIDGTEEGECGRVEIGEWRQGQDVWARWIDGRVQGDRELLRRVNRASIRARALTILTRSRSLSRDSWTREPPPSSLTSHRKPA